MATTRPNPSPRPRPTPAPRPKVDPKKIEDLKRNFANDPQMLSFIEVLAHLFG